MRHNLILDTDSYKSSHYLQYPPGTQGMFSYFESRGGKFDKTLFFGLQYLLKEFLTKPVTIDDVEEAADFFALHGEPFPYEQWLYVVRNLGGKLPIRIRAVPEGSVLTTHSVLMTVESTDPKVFWIVSWLETMFVRLWYPTTVATQSFYIKKMIKEFLNDTADDPNAEINFKLHDFGSRGVSSTESAGIGGMSHLVNFFGSDTVEGVRFANRYYDCAMAGFSIPASEHSTITSWGRDGEVSAFRNMIKQFGKPGGLVACVSDSYDLWSAVENLWTGELLEEVKKSGCTLVIRPDSGNPSKIVNELLQRIHKKLGTTINSKGYRVLPSYFRIIQGDGVNYDSIRDILNLAKISGFSASNIAFGMGGALLQQLNRDTQKFAYKCSSVRINGQDVDVYKDPITDPGKKSKRGRLDHSQLQTVYENGKMLVETTMDEVRTRVNEALNV